MRVLVTGGAGYIGSHIVGELVRQGHEAMVIDNFSTGHKWAVHPEATFLPVDLSDARLMRELIPAIDAEAVIHAAAVAYVEESVRQPLMYYHQNVVNTVVLLDAMACAGIERLVFCSSCLASTPTNPYAESKLMAEMAILAKMSYMSGLSPTILRYHNVAGADAEHGLGEEHEPETHLIPRCLDCLLHGRVFTIDGQDYSTRDGTCIRDYVDVRDVAAITVAATVDPEAVGKTIRVGSAVGASVKEVIAQCEKVTGLSLGVRYGGRRPGNPSVCVAAERHRGVSRNLEDMISSQWQWMRDQQ